MLSVELKVNGTLIGYVYGKNIAPVPGGKYRYEYEYYEPELRELKTGVVLHKREDGLRTLVAAILEDVGGAD